MRVPYTLEHLSDNLVRFNFDGKYAEKVLSVADFHLNNESSKITKERFGNLDEVVHLVKLGVPTEEDKILSITVDNPRQARALKQTFKNYGIAYQSFFSREDNSNVFHIRTSELYANAPFQKDMEGTCACLCHTPALSRDEFEVIKPAGKKVKTHDFAQISKQVKTTYAPTPQKDIIRARESAACRNQEQDLNLYEKKTRSR